jgi:cobalt-zinc-cadmium efflux system protein
MGGHAYGHGLTATGRHRGALAGALAAALAIFAVEVAGALVSGSLALLADAGTCSPTPAGSALALGATLLASRPAAGHRTFGWARAEILAAAANGLVLAGMGVYVFIEGVRRLVDPAEVHTGGTALFAAIGLAGNLAGVVFLYRTRKASLNLRGAFLEVATDTATLGRGAAAAGDRADRVHSRVHDLHVRTVTSGLPVLPAHVVVDDECFHSGHAPQMLDAVQTCLAGHFDVEHSTIQLETAAYAVDPEAADLLVTLLATGVRWGEGGRSAGSGGAP